MAVTVIAQRPAVRLSGGNENDPSWATSTVGPAAGVGAGAPLAPGVGGGGLADGPATTPPPSGPRKRVVTMTVFALVVVPSTAIAPLP